MKYEITTPFILDADERKDTALAMSAVIHKDISFSWRDIWRLICGKKLHLRAIYEWHPIGESSATAIVRF